MLTWETLTKCIENGCMDEDIRLIAQLLIDFKLYYSNASIEGLFETVRNRALTNSIDYFQQRIK